MQAFKHNQLFCRLLNMWRKALFLYISVCIRSIKSLCKIQPDDFLIDICFACFEQFDNETACNNTYHCRFDTEKGLCLF